MLNCSLHSELRYRFLTACGLIGAVRELAIELRKYCASEHFPAEYEARIQRIETNLGILLQEFQHQADGYQIGNAPIDFTLADITYNQGVQRWRENLEQLLQTATDIMQVHSVIENETFMETFALLLRLQQVKPHTLKELLDK